MVAQKARFAEADRAGAKNMAAAGALGGLERIIYLGGLGEVGEAPISKHLRSRHEVGDILHSGPVPCTTLRAAMIIGSGSASFEILRYLTERLPVMTTPRWVTSPNQPIAISNVLGYLKGCLECTRTAGQVFDIGGPEIVSYRRLIDLYAEEAGLPKRLVIPVPVLTPTLSAHWIHLVTPVPAAIALPLTEGLTSAAVCRDNRIRDLVPQKLLGCREAVRRALDRLGQHQVQTCWKDAGRLLPPEWAYCGDTEYAGGTVRSETYRMRVEATADQVWSAIACIGGDTGWYGADLLWRIRGAADRLVGGDGLRRGRRHPFELFVGDAVDFWRVLEVDPPRRLVLLAEMRLPGQAMMGFEINDMSQGRSEVRLGLRFFPRGLSGLAYWAAVKPLHPFVFRSMLAGIGKAVGRPVIGPPEALHEADGTVCRLPQADAGPGFPTSSAS
jgi:uncharacterized protein YbjT (DUF2867 family)